jgi:hypothetical protein
MSDLQRDSTPPQPAGEIRQRHVADKLLGSVAARSLVPCDVPADIAPAAIERKKNTSGKEGTQPMHTE